jgi:hypothetical protein
MIKNFDQEIVDQKQFLASKKEEKALNRKTARII